MLRVGSVVLAVASSLVVVAAPPGVAATASAPRENPADRPARWRAMPPHALPVPGTDESDARWLDPRVDVPVAGEAVVDVPAGGLVRAGDLPLYVGRAGSAEAPARVRVRLLDRAAAEALGARFVAFTVSRADGGSAPARLVVEVDYAGVARAFGGDFATRLRLVAMPVGARIPARNDVAAFRLAAEVDVAADPAVPASTSSDDVLVDDVSAFTSGETVYAMSSGASGSAGDYSASPLPASAGWQVGLNSGAFTWSYPLPLPPAPAGPTPAFSLDYSSQTVDGRTTASNGQPSQVGEGWSLNPGFVERRFKACADDGQPGWGDLCWDGKIQYFVSMGATSGELVRGADGTWRLRDDPAWRFELRTSSRLTNQNGDNDGEHWLVTSPEGTQYWFGNGREYASDVQTHAALTVPVFGDDAGEPCNAVTVAASWCQQAWRWNLDRVLDVHGNVTTYFWTKENNYYARTGNSALATRYERAGYLDRVEYGKRAGSETSPATAWVQFTAQDRCTADSSCPAATPANATSFPDVPMDLYCYPAPAPPTSCPGAGQTSPTFWTTKRYDRAVTYFRSQPSAAASDVDEYDFVYSFPETGDATSPSLWLARIRRTGRAGSSAIGLDAVTFTGVNLPNRRYSDATVPPMNKYRLSEIRTELGGTISVAYGEPDPCSWPAVPAWDSNATLCFPAWYDGAWVPFRKYVTTRVSVAENHLASATRTTSYTYLGTPAWHYDDVLTTPSSRQSWADYRGYEKVQVQAGSGASVSRGRHVFFRGMHGDKLAIGTSKSVTVADEWGNSFTDAAYLAGREVEATDYSPANVKLQTVLRRYWARTTVAGPQGWQRHDAQYVREVSTQTWVLDTETGDYRRRQVDKAFDAEAPGTAYGLPNLVHDQGALTDPGDNTCQKLIYAFSSNMAAKWRVGFMAKVNTHGGACAAPGAEVSRSETFYDNSSLGVVDRGNVTATGVYYDSAHRAVTQFGYDSWGRVTAVTAPNEYGAATPARTTTSFDPVSYYPHHGVTVTDPAGNTMTTKYAHAWNLPYEVTDPNGAVTTLRYDALGRLTAVRRPLETVDGLLFEYHVAQNQPSWTRQRHIVAGTTYTDTDTYVDGLGRVSQVQAPSPNGGRIVTLTRYDVQGRVAAQTGPVYKSPGTPAGPLVPAASDVPAEQRFGYDALDRPVSVAQYAFGTFRWQTTTTQWGTHARVDHPVRGDVTTHVDVFGRVSRVSEQTGSTPVDTAYHYTARGDLDTITDAHGNVVDYDYDWLGRRTRSADPDQGVWSYGYDLNGNPTHVLDAAGRSVYTAYDKANRRTAMATDSGFATPLATWAYDDPAVNGRGRLVTSTRHVTTAGLDGDYRSTAGYDLRGRITSRGYTLPGQVLGAAGAAPQTFRYDYAHDVADRPATVDYPAAGGLAAERVTFGYTADLGLPKTITGAATYVGDTTYTNVGLLDSRTFGPVTATAGAVRATRSFAYDDPVSRLTGVTTRRPDAAAPVVDDVAYGYDAEGNVVSVDPVAGDRECFGYDPRNRLVRAYTTAATTCGGVVSAGTGSYDLAYTIDDIGNLEVVTDRGVADDRSFDPAGNGGPHALATTRDTSFGYDPNGAMTGRDGPGAADATYAWDALHRLGSVTDGTGTTTMVYDAGGDRIVRRTATETVVYLDGTEITRTAAGTTARRYYGSYAVRDATGVHYLLANHQNSASVAVDAADVTVAPMLRRYRPYGAPRDGSGVLPTERGFLGRTHDPTGLDAVGARYYDAALGVFLSVDPLLSLADPRTLNPYSYAVGNPTTFTDPSGLANTECDGTCYANGGNGDTAATSVSPVRTTRARQGERYLDTIGASTLGGEIADPVSVDEVAAVYRMPKFSQLDPRSQQEVLARTWCSNNPRACAAWQSDQVKDAFTGIGNVLMEVTGVNDLRRCLGGSAAGCLWTAANLVPGAGKLGKLAKLDDLAALSHTDNLLDAAEAGERLLWTSWQNYTKVTQGGREYAQIGDRLYTRHAVDRMQPSGLGTPAGAVGTGRSISPNFVEDVLTSTRGVPVKGPNGEARLSFISGTFQVITEDNIVLTVITR